MRFILVIGVLAFAGAARDPAMAQSNTAPSFPPPGATSCSGCHGELGSSGMPSLTTMNAEAIAEGMIAFKTGEKQSTVMGRIAKGFSDDESRAIGQWLASQGDGK
jgi:cytochrome c553